MRKLTKGNLVALAVALLGVAAVQGCAVTTGRYVPDRSPTVSYSMTSRFDKSHDMRYAEPTRGLATGSALHMPSQRPSGALYFHYY
jgi:hypothetical protein